MNSARFNIAAVERDTGLSKDVLRMWERRYGFPSPSRDSNGERSYPAEQVYRLQLIKRLTDHGHRPGALMGKSLEDLALLSQPRSQNQQSGPSDDPEGSTELLALIKQHDATGYQQAMQQRLARKGLQRFVQDTVAPLIHLVGEAWETGRIEVFEEHLFTEMTTRLLRQAISVLPAGPRWPRVVLTSVPDEPHSLGLLMTEALLALEGAECIPLGTQMPLLDISRAARAHQADVVALSFSTAFPRRQTPLLLKQLRLALPAHIALWVGGRGTARLPGIDGVELLAELDDVLKALTELRRLNLPSQIQVIAPGN